MTCRSASSSETVITGNGLRRPGARNIRPSAPNSARATSELKSSSG